jgi:hypothetical protein
MVYDGALKISGLYEQAEMEVIEANGEKVRALWKSLDEFGEGKSILYPDGLFELLRTLNQRSGVKLIETGKGGAP